MANKQDPHGRNLQESKMKYMYVFIDRLQTQAQRSTEKLSQNDDVRIYKRFVASGRLHWGMSRRHVAISCDRVIVKRESLDSWQEDSGELLLLMKIDHILAGYGLIHPPTPVPVSISLVGSVIQDTAQSGCKHRTTRPLAIL